MTHLTVRQYLDERGTYATRADCIHLARCARHYSRLRHWPVHRCWVKDHTAHLYDRRALMAVCDGFRHSETERQCTQCLKMRRKEDFYPNNGACKDCYRRHRRRKNQTFEGRERLRLRNERDYQRRKARKYAEVVEASVAANR